MDFSYLHNKFFDSYQKRYLAIMSGWRDIRQSHDLTELEQFQFQTHSLKGESGALGFTDLFELVTDLDNLTRTVMKEGFSAKSISDIDNLLNQLIAAHRQDPNPLLVHPECVETKVETKVEPAPSDIVSITGSTTRIALVDDQPSIGYSLTKSLESFGFSVTYFSSIEDCKEAMQREKFSLLLLDIVMPSASESQVFDFATQCLESNVRVISISSKDDLKTRLLAVRSGVDDYALKPININTLISKIKRVCALDIERPYKIVLLDDQTTIAEYFKVIAKQRGFELLTFSDANTFFRNLDVSIPDAFLLDINMPDINGFEVARILRHEARFEYVPIVFLSADDTPATKLDVLSAGGEDVISKSDPPEHIFKQIEYRVTRGQHIRSMAIKDGLTGLLNHGQLMEALSGFKRLAERLNTHFGIAMIDVDNFKKINDTYGHSIGDGVLVGLSQLLKRQVRESDIVGRYGGEEFLIGFQDIKEAKQIVAKLDEIREKFAAIQFETKQGQISATFSCGFVMSNTGGTLGELINRADQAMYEAKKLGKNRVEIYTSS